VPGLDLSPASSVLGTHARRFYDRELPPQLQTQAFARFDKRRFSREQLTWALHAWRHRALDEYRSLVGLAQYLDELGALGTAFDAVSTAVRVVRDEARHVELCRRMVRALGGTDRIPGTPTWVRSNPKKPLLERVLSTTLGSLCIGETLSVALLAATRDVTKEPLAKATLTVLTADESVHSQLGWTLLPLLWPQAPKALRRQLAASVEPSLAYAQSVALEHGPEARPRNPFGDLLPSERAATFHAMASTIRRRMTAIAR
jgi:hypothetical protein